MILRSIVKLRETARGRWKTLNNRKGAKFQTELKDGKLKVVGEVDKKKLSGSELALYNAITNTETVWLVPQVS